MGDILTPLDFVLFFGTLIFAMAVGFIAGRKEETAEDYFLAGRGTPWWGVAGSIFGSNVSANHMVGMMGIGFSVGFAQSHFELGAIAGLMMLCYGFLPVYRRLKVFTLSQYLASRYGESTRVIYAIIMIFIMAVVQMVPALYIGARSICVLLGGDAVQEAVGTGAETVFHVNMTYYWSFVIGLAVISASYTIFGGLKAVIWPDVIQSFLLLAAGLVVAYFTFDSIGGWARMLELDSAGPQKMHLYLPHDHAELPWTGVLTGLMALHCYYWGTNQFIVQRALSARSDREARLGIVAAGFLKLLIPFFAIGSGVAAYFLFQERLGGREGPPDTAFTEVVKLVIPLGTGIVGLIMAGVLGAILSSIDSMMNSAATIVTVDIYQRFIRPEATDREMIFVGRASIALFVVVATLLAMFIIDPNSKENFFLQIVNYQAYLVPGIIVAFFLGVFWRRSTPIAGIVTLLMGILLSGCIDAIFSPHFFHRVVIVLAMCSAVHVVVSFLTPRDREKERLVWSELAGEGEGHFRRLLALFAISLVLYAALGTAMYFEIISPVVCAFAGAAWTLGMFFVSLWRHFANQVMEGDRPASVGTWLKDDRFWAGWLCACAIFMLYYFY